MTAVVVLLLLSSCCEARLKFDFKTRGSARAQLGLSKLARIQKRSGQTHRTLDQLAELIEQDPDLVSYPDLVSSELS